MRHLQQLLTPSVEVAARMHRINVRHRESVSDQSLSQPERPAASTWRRRRLAVKVTRPCTTPALSTVTDGGPFQVPGAALGPGVCVRFD
jgi:hypothetical protein